jgi:hypothetical protein
MLEPDSLYEYFGDILTTYMAAALPLLVSFQVILRYEILIELYRPWRVLQPHESALRVFWRHTGQFCGSGDTSGNTSRRLFSGHYQLNTLDLQRPSHVHMHTHSHTVLYRWHIEIPNRCSMITALQFSDHLWASLS